MRLGRHGVFGLALALGACAAAPPMLDRAATSLPAGESFLAADDATAIDLRWWNRFGDADLSQIVELALAENQRLLGADAGVLAAAANVRLVSLNRSYAVTSQVDGDYGRPAGRDTDPRFSGNGVLTASWEADLWGRLSAVVRGARADLAAADAGRSDVAVIVASEAALAFIDARGAQARLSVARQNADTQAESLDLIRTLMENGRANQLDYERSLAQYRTTLAQIPLLEADADNAAFRLTALTGRAVRPPDGPIPTLSGPLAAGTPDALIARRPDVRGAAARLDSASATGAAARRSLFPRITLTASGNGLFGDLGGGLIGGLDGGELGFGIGPTLSWAGPDLRRVHAAIDGADARTLIAIADYQQTVLNAVRDVEVALTAYAAERRRRSDLQAATDAARRALDIATLRYREGVDDYLDVLDAQRTLLDAEDRLALHELQTARLAVLAYRSLGGIDLSARLLN